MDSGKKYQLSGMKAFMVILIGQFISILGSTMTNFAMTIWAYEKTGRVTDLALVGVFWSIPVILLSPFTGAVVDRFSRKLLMIVADLSSVAVTIAFLILNWNGGLEIWHVYVGVFIMAIFNSVQWPAFSAALTLMISKEQYTRANSLLSISGPGSQIIAPILAGMLIPLIGFNRIMMLDILTASIAVGGLFFIFIPDPEQIESNDVPKSTFWDESMDGFRYLSRRPSLIWLQSMFMIGNFITGLTGGAMLAPMVLARTGNNELMLGSVQMIASIGGVVGGLIIGAWGGYKRQIKGVFLGWFGIIFGGLVAGFGRAVPGWMGVPLWGGGMFITSAAATLVNASNQSIWQSKVPPEMQGRVFSIRRMIAVLVGPIAALIAGPLADNVMEPAMMEGGALVETFSWLVGMGPGAGMSLVMIIGSAIGCLFIIGCTFIPIIRNVEDILPDHDLDALPLESDTAEEPQARAA